MAFTKRTRFPYNWKPKAPGDYISGIYKSYRTGVGPNKDNNYLFEDPVEVMEAGEIKQPGDSECWGSTVLDPILVPVVGGTPTKVIYLGLKINPSTGRTYKDWEVLTDEEATNVS